MTKFDGSERSRTCQWRSDVTAMRDIAGLGADEVCDALGLSGGNQRVLLDRARSRVRAALEVHLDG
jgi:DNA-directed RNA polymerase specialized sigma24 family protein